MPTALCPSQHRVFGQSNIDPQRWHQPCPQQHVAGCAPGGWHRGTSAQLASSWRCARAKRRHRPNGERPRQGAGRRSAPEEGGCRRSAKRRGSFRLCVAPELGADEPPGKRCPAVWRRRRQRARVPRAARTTKGQLLRPRRTRLGSLCLSRRSGTRIGESCHDANGRVYRHGTHGALGHRSCGSNDAHDRHGLYGSHNFVFDDSIGGICSLEHGGEAGVLPPLQPRLRPCLHGTVKRRLWSRGEDSAARGASDDDRASSRVGQWEGKHQPCRKQGVAVGWLG